jgi:hypothetical protein
MQRELYSAALSRLADELGIAVHRSDWTGVDVFLPFVERIKAEEATILVKFDGLRKEEQYTVVISVGSLGEGFIRMDSQTLEDALAYAVTNYAKQAWGFQEAPSSQLGDT